MKPIHTFIFLLLLLLLGGCVSNSSLEVRPFHLRTINFMEIEDPFIRAAYWKRLHGAITAKERRSRLGQYYAIEWKASPQAGPVTVHFDYRQAKTGHRKLRLSKTASAASRGTVEFQFTGENYFKKGRILAWEATLVQGGKLLAQKRSYLWK